MKSKAINLSVCCMICLAAFSGCNKQARLNENPAPDLQVPGTLEEIQSVLDNHIVLNEGPGLGDASSDNYYLPDKVWITLSTTSQNAYVWARDIFMGTTSSADWNNAYEQVFYCNVALKALNKIKKNEDNEKNWNHIKGSALFLRSRAFLNLVQLFALPYDSITSKTDLGIPLRLSEDIADKSVRSSIQETYNQVIADLVEAKNLLPIDVNTIHQNRPGRAAALALLSKVYLDLRKYNLAGEYADGSLELYNKLLDYNTVNGNATFPFTPDNPEIIFYSQVSGYNTFNALVSRGTKIDSGLYQSYDSNDLRRSLYYTIVDGTAIIRSSYTGKIFAFSGIATSEIYLIRAECLARTGNIPAAMIDLNTLSANRWRKNKFVPYMAVTMQEALQVILEERRKELPFRNTRWADLRRLNKEGKNIHLTRIINGQTYELPPNHIRYALPIPPDVIALSGMPQNPR